MAFPMLLPHLLRRGGDISQIRKRNTSRGPSCRRIEAQKRVDPKTPEIFVEVIIARHIANGSIPLSSARWRKLAMAASPTGLASRAIWRRRNPAGEVPKEGLRAT